MNNLAVLYQREHRNQDAEKLYATVIDIQRRVNGPTHPETLNALNNLAVLYSVEGKYSEAAPIYENVLEQWRKQLGPEHPRTLAVMSNRIVGGQPELQYPMLLVGMCGTGPAAPTYA
jgi:non-specific serine/threonine protein kinase/serine/threonine-protein kinase